jgi:uncharacterized protein YjiS (DUF1127 family)
MLKKGSARERPGVVMPTITHIYTEKESRMTALIMTADTIGHKIKDWFKRLVEDAKKHNKAQITIKELSALTDHELNDIGIARGEIYSIAYDLEEKR